MGMLSGETVQKTPDQLVAVATAWAEQDPDPETRRAALSFAERAKAGDEEAVQTLTAAFSGRLAFGTAGLRGPLGPGPKRMNRVVVAQTSAGFAAFLRERAARGETDSPPSVVIGYDGRVNSDVFARDAAEIMAGAGITVFLLPAPGPTPLTAFAVRHLGVSAGVMITASHNPPQDNGYKVYLGDADAGSQIVAPVDAQIADQIEQTAKLPVAALPRSSDYRVLGGAVADEYVSGTAAALLAGLPQRPDGSGLARGSDTELTIVYTAMHGVGSDIARRVFTSAGLPSVVPVPEQDRPDGSFPTVAFPNPEEPGALDLAIRLADSVGAAAIVAHDPDADRLALAAPDPATPGTFRRLTGNELGLLLGWRAAERAWARAEQTDTCPTGTLACTIVSSPALRAVAAEYDLGYVETLSGFKWVSRVPGLIFGFEEALGYLTHPEIVRDKDGISASGDAIAMLRELAAEGRTVWDLLDDASERFGHFASGQITLRLDSMVAATELAARIRQQPPTAFGDVSVSQLQDLLDPDTAEVPADVLRFDLSDGSRVMIRPSGTEPKLKLYLDTFSAEGTAAERRIAAEGALSKLEGAVRGVIDALQEVPATP